jgi:hypothetical protein
LGLTNAGYLIAVFAVALFLLLGCATVSQPLDSRKAYRRDLPFEHAGRKFDGVGVLPRANSYDLSLKPQSDLDVLLLKSCHREIVVEKASGGGLFGKKSFSFQYAPVRYIEDTGICPMKIEALESGTNQYSGALIDFEGPGFTLPYRLYCNGSYASVNGVGICQARSGTNQVLAFDEPVRFAPPQPERCALPKLIDGHYELAIVSGECAYMFDTKAGKIGRLTTSGYDDVVLRKN